MQGSQLSLCLESQSQECVQLDWDIFGLASEVVKSGNVVGVVV